MTLSRQPSRLELHPNSVLVEALLVPFSFEGKPAGTIWVVTHDEQRRFDAEDARLIDNLGRFAAAAYQLRSSLAHAEHANRHKDEFLEIQKRSASKRAFVVAVSGAVQAGALRVSEREAFDHLIVKPAGLRQLKEMPGKASSRLEGNSAPAGGT